MKLRNFDQIQWPVATLDETDMAEFRRLKLCLIIDS